MTALVQLFSAREFLPWDQVLDQVKAAGFDGVEGFLANYEEPEAFRDMLDQRGLTMPQGHFSMDILENDFKKVASIAKIFGMNVIVAPWLAPEERPFTRSGWEALADRLKDVNAASANEGLILAWHNHDFEFEKLKDGSIPIDILLDNVPGMAWEADLGWIFRSGLNPVDWLNARQECIVAVHLKDIQANHDTASEDGWADLGFGINEWRDVFRILPTLPMLQSKVAEHDNPNDLKRFLNRWMESYRELSQV